MGLCVIFLSLFCLCDCVNGLEGFYTVLNGVKRFSISVLMPI